jgi:transcriptional regulator with XRE-family HTH domain
MMVNSTPAPPPRRGKPRASDIDQHVGAMLRARRRLLGMTQQELAERVGITYQQAHKYETDTNRISVGWLYALAEALAVEPGYFFQGLGAGEPLAPRQRQMLELTRSFAALSRRQQEALCNLAGCSRRPTRSLAPGRERRKGRRGTRPEPHPCM